MNKKTITFIAAALAAVTLCSVVGWVLANRERPATAHFGILVDPSDSRLARCDALKTDLIEILASPNLTRHSRLQLYGTGDSSTHDEPVLLETFAIPLNIQALKTQNRAAGELNKFIEGVIYRCQQQGVKTRSPIVLGIKRMLDNLVVAGCKPQSGCVAYIQTDGQELSEPAINAALKGKMPRHPDTLPTIRNESIAIKICGFAQVIKTGQNSSPHNVSLAQAADTVWRGIFTNSESVTLKPHCQ